MTSISHSLVSILTPYYAHGDIAIYHGDCRDVIEEWEGLRTQSFDLLLTDPPYGMNRDGKPPSTSTHGGHKGYPFLGWDDEPPTPDTFARLLSITRHQIIWGGNFFVPSLKPTMKWLVWDKGQRIAQSDAELAWTSMDGALRVLTLNRVAIMTDGAVHPTQKPEALMHWSLLQAPAGVRSVLDPFMGSGTTLVACKRLGLACVGIEREERYCELAAQRLQQEALPFHDTEERLAQPVSLFDAEPHP